MLQDGIEIHFDEKDCCLELSCELDAFSAYRKVIQNDLKNFPEIPLERIIEFRITDTAAAIKRGASPQRWFVSLAWGLVVIVTLTLAFIGAYTIVTRYVY